MDNKGSIFASTERNPKTTFDWTDVSRRRESGAGPGLQLCCPPDIINSTALPPFVPRIIIIARSVPALFSDSVLDTKNYLFIDICENKAKKMFADILFSIQQHRCVGAARDQR